MSARFHLRKVDPEIMHPVEALVFDAVPYGIWDTAESVFVNKYGEPDPNYYAKREIAAMRARDLNRKVEA